MARYQEERQSRKVIGREAVMAGYRKIGSHSKIQEERHQEEKLTWQNTRKKCNSDKKLNYPPE